ncbi:putative ribonuclease H-like domain-containing protein [Tanacetum coccineum]
MVDMGCSRAVVYEDYPHRALKNKGIVDSGCSRHMTGNKAYLAEFQTLMVPCAFWRRIGLFNCKGPQPMKSDNGIGKQHKASCKAKAVSSISHTLQLLHMDLFGPTSGHTRGNTVVPELHKKSGVSGRKNRTLIEAARTMLADSFLPNTFWAEAVSTACYVLNRFAVNNERFLVGYSLQSKAFRVYNLETKRVEENLHITFLENKPNVAGKGPTWLFDLDYLTDSMNYHPVISENQANHHAGQQEANQNAGTEDIIDAGESEKEDESTQDCFVLPIWPSYSSTITPDLKTAEKRDVPREEEQVFMDELERLKRQEKEANEEAEALRKKFEQETENLVIQEGAAKPSSTNIFSTVSTPAKASSTNLVNTVSIPVSTASPYEGLSLSDPTNPEEDDSEIPPLEDIYQNSTDGDPTSAVQTRSKVNSSSRAHAFVSYIQKQKRTNHKDFHHCLFACFLSQHEPKKILEALEDESWVDAMQEELMKREIVVEIKQVVAHGHRQEEGINYDEVFAPVARLEAIRIFLAFASYMDFYSLIKGCEKWPSSMEKIDEEEYDVSCTTRVFQMSSMGELTFFLGLQVKQKADGIFISQDKYVAEILKKFDFANVKTASTPIETQKPLVKDEEASDVDVHLYRSMIGSLMYLTASRPDIMFAVCACSRFQVTPKSSHLSAVKRIFRYLKGKPKLGLWYPRVSSFDLESYSDSDYAGANLDRKSTTGGCQFLGRRLISWQCKKQTIVATSTTEAEYVAAASCCGQVLWIQNQMLDYGFNFMNTKIYIDNESTICIVKNPVYHSKTKHIAIRHHFIRDAYEKKLIQVLKIHTDDNVADLLTKAFDVSRGLIAFRESLKRVTDGTEALLILTLFILWLDKGNSAKGSWPRSVSISEASIRSDLLFDDADGIDSLPNQAIFDAIQLMGRPSEAQPTPSPAPTSEVPHEPQSDSSQCSTLVRVPSLEQQNDRHPKGPSPTTTIPDSIPETSGGNLGGFRYQANGIQHLKARSQKLKKHAKPVIKHQRSWMKSVLIDAKIPKQELLNENIGVQMENNVAQDEGEDKG